MNNPIIIEYNNGKRRISTIDSLDDLNNLEFLGIKNVGKLSYVIFKSNENKKMKEFVELQEDIYNRLKLIPSKKKKTIDLISKVDSAFAGSGN